ncbi:hypothetical protein B0H66DRAFT_535849 [Apodospora peruviana]|uniref:HECT-type E3 ubiquitin transferase n=1 Tax=Apodospora peruviana TaxID=516989 RepID=A0AAE0HYP8_9PEZI|nr:hypothetical protein B0H66DRAFT_535849 [Apodospora peruviana]
MAPWPDRVDSHRPIDLPSSQGQSQSYSTARRPPAASGSTSGRFTGASRMTQFEAMDNLHDQVESSSSDEDLHPQRPRHNRSMSHPFPSLFSSKKKKSGTMAVEESDPDSADEAGPMPKLNKPQTRGHRNGSSVGSRDFSTGNCMTCGSLVRWPRELQVFKCTICLTINDLRPPPREQRSEGTQKSGPSVDERSRSSGMDIENPVSLELTKTIATQCLRSFLVSELGAKSRRGSTAGHQGQGVSASPPSPCRNEFASALATRLKNAQAYGTQQQFGESSGSYLQPNPLRQPNTRSLSTSYPDRRPVLREFANQTRCQQDAPPPSSPETEPKRMFKQLEDYVVSCFTSFQCLNSSFTAPRSSTRSRPVGEGGRRRQQQQHEQPRKESQNTDYPIIDLDAKLLLLGDFAENGSWWTGGQEDLVPGRSASNRSDSGHSAVSSRNPRIDWAGLEEWYRAVIEVTRSWPDVYDELVGEDPSLAVTSAALEEIETKLLAGQEHAQRTLLKASETILKRPGRPITSPHELRFLLIIAENPLLHASYKPYLGDFEHPETASPRCSNEASKGKGPVSGQHSGIIKRIVGLMSNTPGECHNHLVGWFARYPESSFVQMKDLVAGFLAYRLIRQNEKKFEAKVDVTDGLIPSMGAGRSPASLHAALGQSSQASRKQKEKQKKIVYQDDWQIKAASQVLGFLFAANNMTHVRRGVAATTNGAEQRAATSHHCQVLATSDFYMTLLDDSDLLADFEAWERKKGRFAFCQYPFLLSIGAKIKILEYDARRQMENKARDAFFDSIMTHRVVQQFLVLNIRRDCLVDDSLKAVGEVIGGGGEDIKKGLKINFKGEEGVDAGGLRKEWFLLLVREVFNPDHGMFIYDEESQYCYFNPNSLEPSEQFFLVGVVFGLAIYNSTILDVALPPFAFRKLLMAAPPPAVSTSQPRQSMTYTLDDLAEYRPRLAHGLRQLLDYDGDVESTLCLDFMIDTDRYGATERVPLCPGGDRRAVTNANRREYVDMYVRHLLDAAVSRQFEPFKRGFFTVCGGNALSLFRPDEIELLVRGSDEALDIGSLKVVAEYENWGAPNPAETEPIIRWFWDTFEHASPRDQRKLLLFITGSDRIPAMGAASLTIRVSCLGDDCERYPTARTCFNVLALWRYPTRHKLETLLWTAVYESEGFGLK